MIFGNFMVYHFSPIDNSTEGDKNGTCPIFYPRWVLILPQIKRGKNRTSLKVIFLIRKGH